MVEDFPMLHCCNILGDILENTDLNVYLKCIKVTNMYIT